MPVIAPPIAVYLPWKPWIDEFVSKAVQIFQPGQQLTSWYRTADRNAAVGGSLESQHVFALAIDLVGPNQGMSRFLADRIGLNAVQEGSHLHVQLFPAGVLARAGVRFPQPGQRVIG